MLFDNLDGFLRIVAISICAYIGLVFVLRAAGKRALAKLNAFDLVVTVALGSTLATVLLTKDIALLEGLLAFVMLALLQWIVARLSIASPFFRSLVRSEPRVLFEHGEYSIDAMHEERITKDEITSSIRTAGRGSLKDVSAVVLETDGSLSVIQRTDGSLTALDGVKR